MGSAHVHTGQIQSAEAANTLSMAPVMPPACHAGQTGEDVFTGLATPPNPHQWLNAGNWSEGRIPGATDFACIPASYGTYVQYDGNDSISGYEIAGLNDEGTQGLRVVNNTLPIVGTGQASVISDLAMSGITDSGLTVGSGSTVDLMGSATINSSSSAIDGPGKLNIIKGSTVAVSGPLGFDDGLQLRNYGTLSGSGADVCQNGAPTVVRIVNEPEGKMSLTAGSFSSGCGEPQTPGIVANDAKGTISVVGGTFTIGLPFDNLGNVSVTSGVLSLDNGNSVSSVTDTGTYRTKSTKKATGEINFAYPRNETGALLAGSGTYGFSANGIDLADPTLATVVQAGGTNGGMVITKSLTFVGSELGDVTQSDSGTPTTTEIDSGAKLTFGDPGGGGANFTGGHSLVIDSGGKAVDEGTGICLDGGSTITNSGRWTFASGGGSVSNCASGSSSMTNESSGSVFASDPAIFSDRGTVHQ